VETPKPEEAESIDVAVSEVNPSTVAHEVNPSTVAQGKEKKSFNPIKGLENIQELPPVEEKPTEPVESVEEQSEERRAKSTRA
jgi:hypothetical protein